MTTFQLSQFPHFKTKDIIMRVGNFVFVDEYNRDAADDDVHGFHISQNVVCQSLNFGKRWYN